MRMSDYMEKENTRRVLTRDITQVAVVCFDCGKILRWLDINEEAAEKKITDVKIWHSKFCYKKKQLNKGKQQREGRLPSLPPF